MQITNKDIGISLSKAICTETFKESLIRDKPLTPEEVQEIRSQTIVLYLNGDYFPDPEVVRYLFSERTYPEDPKELQKELKASLAERERLRVRLLRECDMIEVDKEAGKLAPENKIEEVNK
jgi:hypothetical protein